MWRKVEYALTKALVPLCEYMLNPASETLENAQKGIEDFIKSLKENKDKFEAYFYYFHLKEKFADVYEAESYPIEEKKLKKTFSTDKYSGLNSKDVDVKGSVIIFDMDSGSLEILGTNKEFEKYVEKVRELGEYPALVSLMEIYVMEQQQDPKPLIREGERLLARNDITEWLKEKTKLVLEVAKDAENEGSSVILYLDPEV